MVDVDPVRQNIDGSEAIRLLAVPPMSATSSVRISRAVGRARNASGSAASISANDG